MGIIMAACSEIAGGALPEDAAEDSFNMLPLLTGFCGTAVRQEHVGISRASSASSSLPYNALGRLHSGNGYAEGCACFDRARLGKADLSVLYCKLERVSGQLDAIHGSFGQEGQLQSCQRQLP